ncbi:MAG: protein of unknown function with transrane region [Parcubacteria group bacterium]|nr:protein of unknown function with transrane region [Parcubacteria group bacterium]
MKKILIGSIALAPFVAFAAPFNGLLSLIHQIGSVIKALIPIVAGLALLYFFWGLAKFILNANDEKKHEEGKNIMIWGIIALFVMVSVWGIVAFIQSNLGLPVTSTGGSSVTPGSSGGGAFDPNCGIAAGQDPC